MKPSWTIRELVDAVNAWCRTRALQPANGQASAELSVRTLRYYRTKGLLDAPKAESGGGYGLRHFLQLAAIRVLQAHGLPLSRIQELLFGRSDQDLKKISESNGESPRGTADVPAHTPLSCETWITYPIDENHFLVARGGLRIPAEQLASVRRIFSPSLIPTPETSPTSHR